MMKASTRRLALLGKMAIGLGEGVGVRVATTDVVGEIGLKEEITTGKTDALERPSAERCVRRSRLELPKRQ